MGNSEPPGPIIEENREISSTKPAHKDVSNTALDPSKVNNKRKLLESIASKLALNGSENKTEPSKQAADQKASEPKPTKQKSDLLEERFTGIVKTPKDVETNPKKYTKPNNASEPNSNESKTIVNPPKTSEPNSKESDILQFWNPQDKVFDSGVINAMLGLSNVDTLENLTSSGNASKSAKSKSVIENVFPEKTDLILQPRQNQDQPSSKSLQGRQRVIQEKPGNPARQHRQHSGEGVMVTQRQIGERMDQRRVNSFVVKDTRRAVDTMDSMSSKSAVDTMDSMDAFLDITLKEEGEEQLESLQVNCIIWKLERCF